jgi:hypothetical protein
MSSVTLHSGLNVDGGTIRHIPNCSALDRIFSMYSSGSWNSLSDGWKVGASINCPQVPPTGNSGSLTGNTSVARSFGLELGLLYSLALDEELALGELGTLYFNSSDASEPLSKVLGLCFWECFRLVIFCEIGGTIDVDEIGFFSTFRQGTITPGLDLTITDDFWG